MNIDNVVDKVRKLLALAGSDNVHEAAKAAAKAQDLIERYQLDEALLLAERSVARTESVDDVGSCVVYTWRGSRIPGWVIAVFSGVAAANRCDSWSDPHVGAVPDDDVVRLEVAGMADDIAIVAAILPQYVEVVDRLHDASPRPIGMDRGEGRRWSHSFRLGAAVEISRRICERSAEERAAFLAERARQLAYTRALAAKDAATLVALDRGDAEPAALSLARADVATALEGLAKRKSLAQEWVRSEFPDMVQRRGSRASSRAGFIAGRDAGAHADLATRTPKRLGP